MTYTSPKDIQPWYTYPVTLHWHEKFGNELERGNDLGMPVGVPVYAWIGGTVLTRSNNDHAVGQQPPPAPNPNPNGAFAETGYNHWGGEVDWYQPGQDYVHYVMHLDQLAVKPGDVVRPGDLLGFSGGENTTDPNEINGQGVVQGYTPTHSADPNTSDAPHIEIGDYKTHDYGSTIDPKPILDALRAGNGPSNNPPPSCGPMPLDPVQFPLWVSCVTSQTAANVGNPLDPSTWVAAITSGFGAPLQRIGLIAFGGLLVLVGIVVLFFGPVEHAAEQAAPMAALA